jgi:hypothetical protein
MVSLDDKRMVLKRLGKGHEVCNILDANERKALRSILRDVNELARTKGKKKKKKTTNCYNWKAKRCWPICKGCVIYK